MTNRWWDDAGDAELRRRLEQRGVHPEIAIELVRDRDDDPDTRNTIDRIVGDA